MNRLLISLSLILISLQSFAQSTDFRRCGTVLSEEEISLNNQAAKSSTGIQLPAVSPSDPILRIPVVFHIIHEGEAIGTGANISDQLIQSQIRILNEDFRRTSGTNGWNNHPSGVDTRIQFELASKDPQGNPTTGIVRVNAHGGSPFFINSQDNYRLKALSFWRSNHYLNIWSCNLSVDLAFAQFPITTLPGLANIPFRDSLTDGVVSNWQYIGANGSVGGSYNLGRTITHEVGHYLGLIHIWGDQTGCVGNDHCSDTPIQNDEIYGCPVGSASCPASNPSGTLDQVSNYLQYTDDACMNLFTNDQATRMRFVLNNSIRRKSLLTSPALRIANLLNVSDLVRLNSSANGKVAYQIPDALIGGSLSVHDIQGKQITSITLLESNGELNLPPANAMWMLQFHNENSIAIKKWVSTP